MVKSNHLLNHIIGRYIMGDWLIDIFNHSEGGKTAVCAICKRKEIAGIKIFPVCNQCAGTLSTGDTTFSRDDNFEIPEARGS